MGRAANESAVVVSERAVGSDQDKQFVMVVGADNKAARRKVTADRTQGTNTVVTSGLQKGDKVIVQGLNGLKQGADIKPVPASTAQTVAPPSGKAGDASSAAGR
jgi:membrane fusion protein (multidrug efflux system)